MFICGDSDFEEMMQHKIVANGLGSDCVRMMKYSILKE